MEVSPLLLDTSVQNCDGKFRNGVLSYIIDVLLALASTQSGSTDLSSSPVYAAQ